MKTLKDMKSSNGAMASRRDMMIAGLTAGATTALPFATQAAAPAGRSGSGACRRV
jgi:hypothetical protein